jgi:hypothetical protein
MLTGRKEETPLAAQVAAVGYIIYGTADVKIGNPFVTGLPILIQ